MSLHVKSDLKWPNIEVESCWNMQHPKGRVYTFGIYQVGSGLQVRFGSPVDGQLWFARADDLEDGRRMSRELMADLRLQGWAVVAKSMVK